MRKAPEDEREWKRCHSDTLLTDESRAVSGAEPEQRSGRMGKKQKKSGEDRYQIHPVPIHSTSPHAHPAVPNPPPRQNPSDRPAVPLRSLLA
ncbi:Hypothetical protein SMAX5B_002133 [Scophthalmus maximus]|uniref:Uncharacterized protein n=1 Tax=Scophthalmus maximus TaxID=52904 RepID=A0A2U9AV30_SCOMX|nr:Hypothetical protein SMAX5B_002133 [Scophthalmus maximus]